MVKWSRYEYERYLAQKEAEEIEKDPEKKRIYKAVKEENDLLLGAMAYLNDHGIWYKHDWNSRRERIGIPDLLICYDGIFVACELKSKTGKIKSIQLRELAKIRKNGGYTFVARNLDEFIYKLKTKINENYPH